MTTTCQAIPAFASDSWDDLALAYMNLTIEYGKCSARHDAVVKAYESLRGH